MSRLKSKTIWGLVVLVFVSMWVGAFVAGSIASKTGSSCNNKTAKELSEQFQTVAKPLKTNADSKEMLASAESYRLFRSYVRSLNVPLLEAEKTAYVNALENFTMGLARYMSSGGTDMSVNETILPLGDARDDFVEAFARECSQ